MTTPKSGHLQGLPTLTTQQVADTLTRLMRDAHGRGDAHAIRELARIQIWLTSTTALARGAQRRRAVRCGYCGRPIETAGELHDLLHQLAVPL